MNVHYIPMPMLTLFRERGYKMADYPVTFGLYQNEITLPLYNGLTDDQVDEVVRVVSGSRRGDCMTSLQTFDLDDFIARRITKRHDEPVRRGPRRERRRAPVADRGPHRARDRRRRLDRLVSSSRRCSSTAPRRWSWSTPARTGSPSSRATCAARADQYIPDDFRTYPVALGTAVFDRLLASEGPFDIVADFAAHKHVRSEKDRFAIEAMLHTNVIDTVHLMDALLEHPPQRFFCVSTDKAANPANVMGASKKLMEDAVIAYAARMPASTARFANVAFSNGSLPDGFLRRLALRQPLSAPSDVRRYFVSPQESGQLCLLACVLGEPGDILFPRLDEPTTMTLRRRSRTRSSRSSATPRSSARPRRRRRRSSRPPPSGRSTTSSRDTSGEKPIEEFHTEDEVLDLERFAALGVVKATAGHRCRRHPTRSAPT